MTTKEQTITVLKHIEQYVANLKELERRDTKPRTHGCILDLEECLNKMFVCMEENRDDK